MIFTMACGVLSLQVFFYFQRGFVYKIEQTKAYFAPFLICIKILLSNTLWGFDSVCLFAYRQREHFYRSPIGGIEMEVQRIENFQIPNAVAHNITQDELQREFNYYKAQKVLETMFMFGMISLDEFNKITEKNRQTFSPFLSEIME